MKYTIILLALTVTLFSSCSRNEDKTTYVNKADYTSYSEYWFDKTVLEDGAAEASPLETEFDFDVLPPNFQSYHRFKIKNTGTNPLKFLAGPKTCKCTQIKIIDREVAPGETGEVEIHWKTIALAKKFNHSASVYTNDPEKRTIKFAITGRVAREVAFTPGLFHMPKVQPDSTETVKDVLIFSEEWDSIEIKGLKSSFGDEAKVELLPLTAEQKVKHDAKVGKNIRLTYKTPEKPGLINGFVEFKIIGPEREIDHRVEVKGKVIRRLSLEETNKGVLTPDGVIHFGRVSRSLGKKEKFLITVNDTEKKLNLTNVVSDPGFVDVSLRPLNSKVEKHGVYVMEVSIPKGLPQANHNRTASFGKLKIEFDHPRVAPFNLKLDFYIF